MPSIVRDHRAQAGLAEGSGARASVTPGRRFLLAACCAALGLALPATPALAQTAGPAAIPGAADPASVAIDFSHCGYAGGGVSLPAVPAVVEVRPSGGDDGAAVQAALDEVGRRPPGRDGFRGAVLLRRGTFRIGGQLRLRASGVVLRGESATLLATGRDRRTLIVAHGRDDRTYRPALPIAGDVAAGARALRLEGAIALQAGDRVVVHRPSTAAWVRALGMDAFAGAFHEIRLDWLPGSRDLDWDRTVVAIDAAAGRVTLDAPITAALEVRFGGGEVRPYTWPGRLQRVGIESLTLVSAFDETRPLDEEHAWLAVSLDHVEDAWVRGVSARHFVSSAVQLGPGARRVTVEDCHSVAPVSERGGWRRSSFLTRGQLVLFDRCTAEDGLHDFAAGHAAAGPTVFRACTARRALGDSGPIESWAAGVLYDGVHVDGASLVLGNLGEQGQGAGWNAANSVAWNSRASRIVAESPPGARNDELENAAVPSLYAAQLAARLGAAAAQRRPSAAPADPPALPHAAAPQATPPAAAEAGTLTIAGGRFTFGGRVRFGSVWSNAWWKGQMVPSRARELGTSLTRWAPGREGPGLTEDLEAVADAMAERGMTVFQAWPGLWYDRRRDDHTTGARGDAAVAAPFYEMPWARSGLGRASDGLSRYDLRSFNPWYFARLAAFADVCARRGLVLVHHFYNNHNLIEAAAHWADFPWRPANCLQDTGFPEPPPYERDGSRIGVATLFYDLAHPLRRELHRLYIRQGLDALAGRSNVVHALAFQDTAPLAFQQFFLDEVAAWKRETGRDAKVALVTGKNVTDAILSDPGRAAVVDVVDLRYWQYLPDGALFAPPAGEDKAYREARIEKFSRDAVPATTPDLAYAQVREYRDRFPDKAIVGSHAGAGAIPVLMAGGAAVILGDLAAAQPFKPERDERALLRFLAERLGAALSGMEPVEAASDAWCLSDGRDHHLLYSAAGDSIHLRPGLDLARLRGVWFDVAAGHVADALPVQGAVISKPGSGAFLLLLQR